VTLTVEQAEKAKAKAIEYLEFSIFTIAMMLNVDLETLDETFVNPVDSLRQGDLWSAYESLILQVKAHSKLVS
jgi:hypothetical protein